MRDSVASLKRRIHAILVAALLVSVACNVAAAEPTWLGRLVAAWPPLALMLVVDVLGRRPAGGGWAGRLQVAGAAGVASVAAVASFAHMHSVALAAGESELVAWLFPLTVDGLAVVCSVALVGINRPEPFPTADDTALLDIERVAVVAEQAPATEKLSPAARREAIAATSTDDVGELAARFGVSTKTIRRDLEVVS